MLAPLADSIIQRARDAGFVEIRSHNLRDWSQDKHRQVDDSPCGGGPGMVLKPEPLYAAITALKKTVPNGTIAATVPCDAVNPHFPRPSGPTQWLFQGPPTESKVLAAKESNACAANALQVLSGRCDPEAG